MGQATDGVIALLSIHPLYVQAILSGAKLVEFRRRPFARPLSHVIIYATTPVKRVVAICTVRRVTYDSPTRLWARYRSVAGIDENAFFRYMGDRDSGVGIEFDRVEKLAAPVRLASLSRGMRPPQSFVYLSDTEFDRIQAVGVGSRGAGVPRPGNG